MLKNGLSTYLCSNHLMVNVLSFAETLTLHFSRIIFESDNIHHSGKHLLEIRRALSLLSFMLKVFLLSSESYFPDWLREHGCATLTELSRYL